MRKLLAGKFVPCFVQGFKMITLAEDGYPEVPIRLVAAHGDATSKDFVINRTDIGIGYGSHSSLGTGKISFVMMLRP